VRRRLVVYGEPSLEDIETMAVGNFNGVLRERLGCLVRGSRCFSKVRSRFVCGVELFWVLLEFY
jgi:hypothetical protein